MVACAALPAQPLISLVAPMTTSAVTVGYLDQLKQQLLTAVENGDEQSATTMVAEVERLSLTKKLLEDSRFGASFNAFRKNVADKWPDIGKRCRRLIKNWQQICQSGPATGASSCASSANGTPNVAGRRLTPATPASKRVSSTGISDTRQTLSPSGGYAIRATVSPQNAAFAIHKSQSVGADLAKKGCEEIPRNGKRKADTALTPSVTGSNAGLKRTRTVAGQLASPAPRTESSVLAARRTVAQSTADLISQLSSTLPEHMNIDQNVRLHEEKVKREQADEELAFSLAGQTQNASLYTKGKRKYERKLQIKTSGSATNNVDSAPSTPTVPLESRTVDSGPKGGIILRLSRTPSILPESPSLPKEASSPLPSKTNLWQPDDKSEDEEDSFSSDKPNGSSAGKAVDWLAMLPSLDELRIRATKLRPITTVDDTKLSHLIKVRDRSVLALPLLSDVDSRPDFILHDYPEKVRFYAEENFVNGGERPNE